jgi:hypothetical protein
VAFDSIKFCRSGGKPLPLTLSDSAACNLSVIAWGGVYLDANLYEEEEVRLVTASRVELQLLCGAPGLYSLDTEGAVLLNHQRGKRVFFPLQVHANHYQIVDHYSEFDQVRTSTFAGRDNCICWHVFFLCLELPSLHRTRSWWRDTLHLIADVLTFRFLAADLVG